MTIKNKQLMRHTVKTKDGDLPDMYDSKLFARQHPRKEGSQYSKSETVPDPQFENLEPDPDDLENSTKKATEILKGFFSAPDLVKAGADVESAGREVKPEGRKIREYSNDFTRISPGGISGSSSPDFPWRGNKWHSDEEENSAEPSNIDKKPVNLLAGKSAKDKKEDDKEENDTKQAIKALAGAPKIASGPVFIPPREKDFMLENGYTQEEIDSGAELTPRLRAMYNRFLQGQVAKSISGLLSK